MKKGKSEKKDEVKERIEDSDEELTEAEESVESDEEPSEETFIESADGDSSVSNFSLGNIGLATANTEGAVWNGNLEKSLSKGSWDSLGERKDGREENNFYQGGVDECESNKSVYSEIEHGADFYTGGGKGIDLYAADSGNYHARDQSGEFYDPRIGRRADVEEVRLAGKSKLEINGLQSGFGSGTEKDIRDKRDDKKYNN